MSQLDFCPFGIAKLGNCLWSHTFSPSARQDMWPEIAVLASRLREVYTHVPFVWSRWEQFFLWEGPSRS
jgi:hypothetical protein